jgi:hypothetical protein
MPSSTIIEETKIPKLGKHSHINSDGDFSTRHTNSTSGLYGNAGCSLPYYATLVSRLKQLRQGSSSH